jgi:stage III sporulation protein AF
MISGLGNWIRAIAGAAVICGAALALTPQSKVKEVLKVLCGVVLIVALIEPFINSDAIEISVDLSRYREAAAAVAGNAANEQTNLNRSIIERQMNSYILDKAQTLGIEDLNVITVLKWGDEGFWYPHEIRLTTSCAIGERNRLSSFIEGELGIPVSRQYWNEHDDEGARDES